MVGVDFRWGELSVFFRVRAAAWVPLPKGADDGSHGLSSKELRVRAEEVEDWAFRPEHNLLEGCCEIQLVTDDPKLTRAHLESLDCEGWRTTYPEKVVMLRFGSVWVVAERFDAAWVEPQRGTWT